jgi:hypothetical protein
MPYIIAAYKNKNLLLEIYSFIKQNNGIEQGKVIKNFGNKYFLKENDSCNSDIYAISKKINYLIECGYLVRKNGKISTTKKEYKSQNIRLGLKEIFDRSGRVKALYRHQEIKIII